MCLVNKLGTACGMMINKKYLVNEFATLGTLLLTWCPTFVSLSRRKKILANIEPDAEVYSTFYLTGTENEINSLFKKFVIEDNLSWR